jgi:hypothetical protein
MTGNFGDSETARDDRGDLGSSQAGDWRAPAFRPIPSTPSNDS